MITVYFDGACWPRNPGGRATWGYVIKNGQQPLKMAHGEHFPEIEGATSNNVAEYAAVINALKWLEENDFLNHKIIVKGDSNLVIMQLSGLWKVKRGAYAHLAHQAKYFVSKFSNISFEWIRREDNEEADVLSKVLMFENDGRRNTLSGVGATHDEQE